MSDLRISFLPQNIIVIIDVVYITHHFHFNTNACIVLEQRHQVPVDFALKFQYCLTKVMVREYSCIYDPEHPKAYIRTCAPSADSDQTAHSRSLIRIFNGRILDS